MKLCAACETGARVAFLGLHGVASHERHAITWSKKSLWFEFRERRKLNTWFPPTRSKIMAGLLLRHDREVPRLQDQGPAVLDEGARQQVGSVAVPVGHRLTSV